MRGRLAQKLSGIELSDRCLLLWSCDLTDRKIPVKRRNALPDRLSLVVPIYAGVQIHVRTVKQ